jgi:hypothetical protein
MTSASHVLLVSTAPPNHALLSTVSTKFVVIFGYYDYGEECFTAVDTDEEFLTSVNDSGEAPSAWNTRMYSKNSTLQQFNTGYQGDRESYHEKCSKTCNTVPFIVF